MFSRGIMIFILQVVVCVAIAAIGVWSITRPRHFQIFINHTFALLPDADRGGPITPIMLRLAGVYFLWVSYSLSTAVREEISGLARIYGVTP